MNIPKYTIKEIKPRIFLLKFKSNYDLCMFFLRYQEHYESPNPKFRDQTFEILDFMEWYSKKVGKGAFTYPVDWIGFNIPSYVVPQVRAGMIMDRNIYDYEMWSVYKKCAEKYPDENFYLIGVTDSKAISHEVAHGFFYTKPEYRERATKLVKALKPDFRKSMCKTLKELGYTTRVHIDECQAYLSTGLVKNFTVKLKGEDEPFIEMFKEFYND